MCRIGRFQSHALFSCITTSLHVQKFFSPIIKYYHAMLKELLVISKHSLDRVFKTLIYFPRVAMRKSGDYDYKGLLSLSNLRICPYERVHFVT